MQKTLSRQRINILSSGIARAQLKEEIGPQAKVVDQGLTYKGADALVSYGVVGTNAVLVVSQHAAVEIENGHS
jgi:hypothetical protein